MVPILSEINSVHTPTSCVFKIHFTIILFTHTYDFQVISTLRVLHESDAHLFSDLWFMCLVLLVTAAISSCQSSFHYYSATASCIITTYMVKLPLCSPWRQACGAEVWLHSFLMSANLFLLLETEPQVIQLVVYVTILTELLQLPDCLHKGVWLWNYG